MAGDAATADVVQDANVDLWANKDQYDQSRPFLPWALRFAYHRVLAFRKTRSRSRLVFSDEFVATLSERMAAGPIDADRRLATLSGCLDSLNAEQRSLIRQRYVVGGSVKGIASKINATTDQISSRLYRIRRDLAKCIERKLAVEGH